MSRKVINIPEMKEEEEMYKFLSYCHKITKSSLKKKTRKVLLICIVLLLDILCRI